MTPFSEQDVRTFARAEHLSGRIRVPGDKSITHRAILLGLLAEGTTTVHGFLNAADCRSSITVARQLGAEISVHDDVLTIVGTGGALREPNTVLDCGNSGTTMRLFAGAIAARVPFACMTGDASLCNRPMRRVIEPLTQMGADIRSRLNGCAPLAVIGGLLTGVRYRVPIPSAQVKSAVLLAGLLADRGDTVVTEAARTRDHTENMLAAFGAALSVHDGDDGGRTVMVSPQQTLRGTRVDVPGDISSAAFLMAAAAMNSGSDVTVEQVGLNHGRTGILDVLRAMGADVEILNERTTGGERMGDVRVRGRGLTGTRIEGDLIPRLIDELPVIAVMAAVADGETIIRDAAELRVKETDRIEAMASGLAALGVQVETLPDGMRIRGGRLRGGVVDSRHDHRIAMSFAIAGLAADAPVEIQHWGAVEISYPTFADAIAQLCTC